MSGTRAARGTADSDRPSAHDFIIVGAGSAGCVLANKLTADPSISVLLIEEGPHDDNWLVTIPKGFGKLLADPQRAVYHETTRITCDGVNEQWGRGRMLGGSSSINGMVWMHCQHQDFDRLEELGNPGWNWASMAPHFRALENYEHGETAE